MTKVDDLENGHGHVHVRRGERRTTDYWIKRLDDLEQHHARRRRAFDSAVSDYQAIAEAMATAQAEERLRPAGRDPQAEFGAELEQARLAAERHRLSFYTEWAADLQKLTVEVSRERDRLIRETEEVRALERAVGTAAEEVRNKLWYVTAELDQARNVIEITAAAKEAQQRASREVAEERGRYGRGWL
jgi:hypothetical protein